MPYEGAVPATPDELKARGLLPQGPLSAPMDPSTPKANEQAIKDQKQEAVVQTVTKALGPRLGLPGFTPMNLQGVRQVAPGTPTQAMPSPAQFIGSNAKQNAPYIGALAGGMAPGGLLGRMAGATGGSGVGALLSGQDPKKAMIQGAIGQAGGEGLGKVGQMLGNNVLRNQFANEQAGKVLELLKKNVPALKPFGNDAPMLGGKNAGKALHEIVYGQDAQAAVSAEFDKALKAGIEKAKKDGIRVPILDEDAAALGLTDKMTLEDLEPYVGKPAKALAAMHTGWPADKVAEALVGKWKSNPGMYRRVAAALDDAGVGDPAARKAYKYYTGFANYADKTKMLTGEEFNPELAMGGKHGNAKGGLSDTKQVNELRKRGMGDMIDLLRGPGSKPMTKTQIGPWTRRAIGATVGEGLGMLGTGSLGGSWPGGLAGAGAGELLIPSRIYHNTPVTPGLQSGLAGGQTALGQLATQYFKQMQSSS